MITVPTIVRTDRFYFRRLEDSDAPALLIAAQETQKELFEWYGGTLSKPDLTLTQVKTYIADCTKEFEDKTFILYGVFDGETDELVGAGCLHHLDWSTPKGRIGYWVRSGEQGKGTATEIAHVLTHLAMNKLALERIEIRAEPRNPASGAVARKLGYRYLTLFEKNKRAPNGDLWNLEIYVRHDGDNLPVLKITYR